jgi:hypothetical protein
MNFWGFTPGIFWGLHQEFFGVYTRNFLGFTPEIFWGLRQEFLGVYTRIFFSGKGVQQIQLRTEGRENGDLGAVAPQSGFPLNFQINETHILIRLLQMYIPRNWEFGSALTKLRIFGGWGVLNPPNPPFGTPLIQAAKTCHVILNNSALWKEAIVCSANRHFCGRPMN